MTDIGLAISDKTHVICADNKTAKNIADSTKSKHLPIKPATHGEDLGVSTTIGTRSLLTFRKRQGRGSIRAHRVSKVVDTTQRASKLYETGVAP